MRKAFDIVQLPVLLKRLADCGLSIQLLQMFQTYLYGRYQYVRFCNVVSPLFEVKSGVGQGSKLGPLFFLILINNICDVVQFARPYLFADDLKICMKINNLNDCIKLQQDINSINNWCTQNFLSFNTDKCYCFTFTLKKQLIHYEYRIGNSTLKKPELIKDLGVTFDSKLSFDVHINNIVNSAFKMLGFLKRNSRDFKNEKTLITLYKSFVRSKLEYCSLIWDPLYENHINQIERVQKKFLRFLNWKMRKEDSSRLPYSLLCERYQMSTLQERRSHAKILYLHKILHGHEDNPSLLSSLGILVSSTRSHGNFYVPTPRTNVYKKCPVFSLCSLANKLDNVDLFRYRNTKKFRSLTTCKLSK